MGQIKLELVVKFHLSSSSKTNGDELVNKETTFGLFCDVVSIIHTHEKHVSIMIRVIRHLM